MYMCIQGRRAKDGEKRHHAPVIRADGAAGRVIQSTVVRIGRVEDDLSPYLTVTADRWGFVQALLRLIP